MDYKQLLMVELEKFALGLSNNVIKGFAEQYTKDKVPVVGEVIAEFIPALINALNQGLIDKIDGQDNIA